MEFIRFRKIILSTAVSLLLVTADANSQTGKVIMSADDAIAVAMRNNAELEKAKLDELKAATKVSEVYSENLVPTADLRVLYTRSFKKQVITIFGETFEVGSDNAVVTSLNVTEPIPILGTPVFSGIRIAEYYEGVQKENVKRVEAEIKNNVRKAYYGVLLSEAVHELNLQTQRNAEENLKVVDGRYRLGVATEFDQLRARVKLENILPSVSRSERNLEISKKVLAKSMGIGVSDSIDVRGELGYDTTEVKISSVALVRKITDGNVLVRQLTLSKKINEELVRVDNASYWPKFFLFGNWTNTSNENDGTSIGGFRFFNTLSAGIGFSWDLNLFRNSYKKEQSQLEVRKSEEELRDTKDLLKLTSESAFIALDDARQRIISQRSTMELAEKGVDLANKSYIAGVLTQIDVLDAELSLYQSKLGFLQAVYDYQVAKAEIQKLLEE